MTFAVPQGIEPVSRFLSEISPLCGSLCGLGTLHYRVFVSSTVFHVIFLSLMCRRCSLCPQFFVKFICSLCTYRFSVKLGGDRLNFGLCSHLPRSVLAESSYQEWMLEYEKYIFCLPLCFSLFISHSFPSLPSLPILSASLLLSSFLSPLSYLIFSLPHPSKSLSILLVLSKDTFCYIYFSLFVVCYLIHSFLFSSILLSFTLGLIALLFLVD